LIPSILNAASSVGSLPNLEILVRGKNGKNSANSRKKSQKFEISNFKEKKLFLMRKSFKVILIKH
jgi:hypothetical protein